MRDDDRIDIGEFVRGAERTAEERRRKRLATWRAKTSLLAPLLVIIGALAMYGDWETPYDRRTPSDDEHDDVASWRASPLPSNPAALPVLVQRDIEQLVAVDRTDVSARAARDGTALRTERRVTLLRAYAVLRYDEAGPLLEDVVDTATDERVRAEAVTMLGYVGYPSWRLLDELVDARDAGRDLMPHVKALWYFFRTNPDPPIWIRDAVLELLSVSDGTGPIDVRRWSSEAVSTALRSDPETDWIEEIERLSMNRDPRCRARALSALRGASVSRNPERSLAILVAAIESRFDDEAAASIARVASPKFRSTIGPNRLRDFTPALVRIACDSGRRHDLRVSALRALRFLGVRDALLDIASTCPDLHDEAAAQVERIGVVQEDPIPRAVAAPPTAGPLQGLIRGILEDRRNDRTSNRDVVHGSRRVFAVDPLRRIAREIRREVLK